MADNERKTPSHIDEGTMHAWLDGALSPDEASSVETHVANCTQCSAAAAEARGLIAASTRILSALDDVPANIIPVPKSSGRAGVLHPKRRWNARMYGPIAAVAVFAVGAMLFLRRAPTLVPISASSAVATMPVAPQSSEGSLPVASVPKVPAKATESKPVVHAAPTPLVAAAIEKRRAAAATTTASDAATEKSAASALRFDATKPAAGAAEFRARLAEGAVAGNAVSSLVNDSVTHRLGEVATQGMPAKGPPTLSGARVVATNEYNSGGRHVRRTVFALESGASVTLVESTTLTPIQAAANAETTARAVPLALRAPSLQDVQSVMWRASDGTMYTLSGPLTVSELEALKSRIVP